MGLPWWVWALGAASSVLYLSGSLWLFTHYRQPAFDLGLYEQTSWLLAHGESFNSVAGIHVFGAHFSPVLILTAPLALIPGGPIPELAFQALWVAIGVVPA